MMNILIIHNKYGKLSGEETVVESIQSLLLAKGHKVSSYLRDSADISRLTLGKTRALLSGIYGYNSIKEINTIIKNDRPNLVHVHNLYPFISPAVLPTIKRYSIPIVMTVHNYRLLCPNGLFYNGKEICEKCTGYGKELNCIMHNCEMSLFKSAGYALRNAWARRKNYYINNIDAFICLSHFQRNKLLSFGFPEEKLYVIANMYTLIIPETKPSHQKTYVAYAGRLSKEKGLDLLILAAKALPTTNFKLAGSIANGISLENATPNVEVCGFLKGGELSNFYNNAYVFINTSKCYETFGLVFLDAMAHRLPIIAPEISGIPEIVEDGHSGLLYSMGDHEDLIKKIKYIWENPKIAEEMGQNGFKKLKKEYSPDIYYKKLVQVYNQVLHQNKK
jgi:glycosyltransferase involved in cell wall biosynthesis